MHRRSSKLKLWQRIALFLGISTALVAATAGIASAVTEHANVGLKANGNVYVCIGSDGVWHVNKTLSNAGCPAGSAGLNFYGVAPVHADANANTHLTNRDDSGVDGTNWATDDMARSAAFTEQTVVTADKCGPTAAVCYLYTGSVSDVGTFTTKPNAHSPNDGAVTINGTVTGTIIGGSKFEFYANSLAINGGLVDANQAGALHSTSAWFKQFFPAGTLFGDTGNVEPDWSWTYTAPATCEQWKNAVSGNTGNITGTNHC